MSQYEASGSKVIEGQADGSWKVVAAGLSPGAAQREAARRLAVHLNHTPYRPLTKAARAYNRLYGTLEGFEGQLHS